MYYRKNIIRHGPVKRFISLRMSTERPKRVNVCLSSSVLNTQFFAVPVSLSKLNQTKKKSKKILKSKSRQNLSSRSRIALVRKFDSGIKNILKYAMSSTSTIYPHTVNINKIINA